MSVEKRPSKQGSLLTLLTAFGLAATGCRKTLFEASPPASTPESKPITSLSKPEKALVSFPKEKTVSFSPIPKETTPTEKVIFSNPTQTSTPEPSPFPSLERTISEISFFPPEQLGPSSPEENIIFSGSTWLLKHPWLEPLDETLLVISPTPTETSTPTPIPTAISTPAPSPTLPPRPRSQIITPETTAEVQLSLWEEKALEAVQKVRTESNLSSVTPLPILMEIARRLSQDMAERNYFNHYTPEGKTVSDFLKERGYQRRVDEILAKNNIPARNAWNNAEEFDQVMERSIERCISDLLESPSHRPILLGSRYQSVGISVAFSEEDGITYLTIIFSS